MSCMTKLYDHIIQVQESGFTFHAKFSLGITYKQEVLFAVLTKDLPRQVIIVIISNLFGAFCTSVCFEL